ncbi:MAG: large conductance mechanosensitive channel protein MscL [Vicinamibacterales bacterium]
MLDGFKKFVARGNVVDLAVGVIIGASVGEIVNSLVKDIITPIIGMLGGQPDFSAIRIGGIGLGSFVNNVMSFLIKAGALYFFIVLPFNRFAAKLTPPPSPTEALLAEIRDAVKAR